MYTFFEKKEILLKYVNENQEYKNLVSFIGYTVEHYLNIVDDIVRDDIIIKITKDDFLSKDITFVTSNTFCYFDVLKVNELVKLYRYSKFLIHMHKYVIDNFNELSNHEKLKEVHTQQYLNYCSQQGTLYQITL